MHKPQYYYKNVTHKHVLSFFPRDVLDEIWDLIESVSEDFPSYCMTMMCVRLILVRVHTYKIMTIYFEYGLFNALKFAGKALFHWIDLEKKISIIYSVFLINGGINFPHG